MNEKTQELVADVIGYDYLSDCCGAPVVMGDICMDCKEHCEPIEDIDE